MLGADIVSTFDTPDLVKLGTCDVIQEIMLGEDKVSSSKGPPGELPTTLDLR